MTIRSLLQAFACSLVLPLILVGCGSGNDTDDKTDCLTALRINLEVADGTIIDEVEYEITGNGMMPMGDTINTSAPGATASVEHQADLVAVLLGVADITVPWETLILSVVLFVALPLAAGLELTALIEMPSNNLAFVTRKAGAVT